MDKQIVIQSNNRILGNNENESSKIMWSNTDKSWQSDIKQTNKKGGLQENSYNLNDFVNKISKYT